MNILGITGSLSFVYENSDGDKHDSAAALIVNGEIVAAIEEERLNRIKHSDKFPVKAIENVLNIGNLWIEDIDYICYYSQDKFIKEGDEIKPVSEIIKHKLNNYFNYNVEEDKLCFVNHHLGHLASSYYLSGFNDSLILSIDGQGDGLSGILATGSDNEIKIIEKYSVEDSLGIFYLKVIYALGYKQFDEYKVMGLAPYGNPEKYKELFDTFYTLLPGGRYKINVNQIQKCYLIAAPRKKGEPFNQIHKDIAASLQNALEEIVLHILKYNQKKYNQKNLCLAGGVAHNCSVNGKVLYSNLFENIFIQPAAHDAGCAVGIALNKYYELNNKAEKRKLQNVYLGNELANKNEIESLLSSWSEFVHFERMDNVVKESAKLISDGAVIGWVQGRSEFGPRALGNRSILADPRPAENKDKINAMVKKRESYRPFAPSVMVEYLDEFFDLPKENMELPYMIFVINVKEKYQKTLGAVTHFDGTARVQTVSKDANKMYWELINEFRNITSIPMLLNTSFNNNAEPIVDSAYDALICLLTTGLDYLVIDDYLVRKKHIDHAKILDLNISIPRHNVLQSFKRYIHNDEIEKKYYLKNNFINGYETKLSLETFDLLNNLNGDNEVRLMKLIEDKDIKVQSMQNDIAKEILDLWHKRFIRLEI